MSNNSRHHHPHLRSQSASQPLASHPSSNTQDISSIKLHPCHPTPSTYSNLKQTLPIPDPAYLTSSIVTAARRWILTLALINFDLDQGPDFDNCYPPLQLTSHQMSNISFSSFPDCAKGGSLIFSWRIPGSSSSGPQSNRPSVLDQASNNPLPFTSSLPHHPLNLSQSTSSAGHLHLHSNFLASLAYSPNSDLCGYVYFIQEKNPAVLRGYNQHSLVLITHLSDYVGLFSTLVSRLGPLYVSQGPKSLETAIHNIASWPDVIPGSNPELTFLGQQHRFILPLKNQAQVLEPQQKISTRVKNGKEFRAEEVNNPRPSLEYSVLASNPTTYLSYILFGPHHLPHSSAIHASCNSLSVSSLWILWELLILGEPLVVFGSTPDIVSDTILHLKNLIRPIPFHSNWRPYITIHDPDFPILFSKNTSRTVGLIGVTNPIILTNINSWSNVLCLTTQQGGFSNQNIGLMTDRKRVLHKNKQVVKQLQLSLDQKDYHQADVIISRHFSLLTEQFLQPLQRYFTTLLPLERASAEPERTRSFNSDLFLKSLKEHATALEFRSRLTAGLNGSVISIPGFYTSFLRSPNFSAWLHYQVDLANIAVRNRYLVRMQSTPLNAPIWASPSSHSNSYLHRYVNGLNDVALSSKSYSTAPNSYSSNSRSTSIVRSNSISTKGDIKTPRPRGSKKKMNLSLSQSVQELNQFSENHHHNQDLNSS